MGVAVEMLSRKFEQLRILQRFHLMNQSDGNIHAITGVKHKLLDRFRVGGFLDPDQQFSGAQIEGFGFQAMIMKGASLALADFEDFAAIQAVVGDPDLATPSFGLDVHRFAYSAHMLKGPDYTFSENAEMPDGKSGVFGHRRGGEQHAQAAGLDRAEQNRDSFGARQVALEDSLETAKRTLDDHHSVAAVKPLFGNLDYIVDAAPAYFGDDGGRHGQRIVAGGDNAAHYRHV